jgi:hypothetical protein
MKKEYTNLRPFPDVSAGKGRFVFLSSGCDSEKACIHSEIRFTFYH